MHSADITVSEYLVFWMGDLAGGAGTMDGDDVLAWSRNPSFVANTARFSGLDGDLSRWFSDWASSGSLDRELEIHDRQLNRRIHLQDVTLAAWQPGEYYIVTFREARVVELE